MNKIYFKSNLFTDEDTRSSFEVTGDSDKLIKHFKDFIVLKDGKVLEFPGRGIINNRISCILMSNIENIGIKTNFVKTINMREHVITKSDPMMVYAVIRNYANEETAKKFNVPINHKFNGPIIEWYFKNPNTEDPMVNDDQLLIFEWINFWEIEDLRRSCFRINDFLLGFFSAIHIKVSDVKLEFSRKITDEETMKILLTGELNLDTIHMIDMNSEEPLSAGHIKYPEKPENYKKIGNRIKFDDFKSGNDKESSNVLDFKSSIDENNDI